MKREISSWYQKYFVCLVLVTLPFFGACRSLAPRSNTELRVVPISGQPVALEAKQIVELCQRAGLEHEEILETGTHIRNAISSYGGCRVYRNRRVYMIIAVQDQNVYVSLHTGDNFIYDLENMDE